MRYFLTKVAQIFVCAFLCQINWVTAQNLVAEPITDGRYRYFNNGFIRVGFDLRMGGVISHISRIGDGRNIVNNYDAGRQAGIDAYWGPEGTTYCPQPIDCNTARRYSDKARWNGLPQGNWVYNPAYSQTDHHLGGAPLDGPNADFAQKEIYVKSKLWDWQFAGRDASKPDGYNKVEAFAYSETRIRFQENGIRVSVRITRDLSKININPAEHGMQIGAYIYGNYDFRIMKTFMDGNPWTNSANLATVDLSSAPGSTRRYSPPGDNATESWMALVDGNDRGYGIFSPETQNKGFIVIMENHGDGGGEFNNSSSFLVNVKTTPQNTPATTTNDFHIMVGTTAEMRQYVYNRHSGTTTTPPVTPTPTPTTPPPAPTPPPSPTTTCVNCEGHFDAANCSQFSGWVWSNASPATRQTVSIYEGNTLIASGVANGYRADLQGAGKGDGRYAFNIDVPATVKSGTNRTFVAKVGGYTLNNTKTINCAGTATVAVVTTPPPAPEPTPAPTVPSGTCGNCEGHLDGANCSQLSGWVWSRTTPATRQTVGIYAGNTLVASGVANSYRADLQGAGKGDGRYAFSISVPASLKNGGAHTLVAKVGTYELNGSPKIISGCWNNGRLSAETNPETLDASTNLRVYPNPSTGKALVTFNLMGSHSAEVSVATTTGLVVRRYEVKSTEDAPLGKQLTVDLTNHDAGLYYVTLKTEYGRFTQKLLLVP